MASALIDSFEHIVVSFPDEYIMYGAQGEMHHGGFVLALKSNKGLDIYLQSAGGSSHGRHSLVSW